jgi:hypothetical protein
MLFPSSRQKGISMTRFMKPLTFYSISTAYLSPTMKRLRFPFNATDGLVICLRLRRVQFALLCVHSKSPEASLSSSISVSVLINQPSSRGCSVYPIYCFFTHCTSFFTISRIRHSLSSVIQILFLYVCLAHTFYGSLL